MRFSRNGHHNSIIMFDRPTGRPERTERFSSVKKCIAPVLVANALKCCLVTNTPPWRTPFPVATTPSGSAASLLDDNPATLDSDCLSSFLYLFAPLHPPLICEDRSGYLRSRAIYATSFRGIKPTSIHSSRFEYRM
jgi:hypothetical protein